MIDGIGLTQTERTLALVKNEWQAAERQRILAFVEAIDPVDWALGSAYDQIVSMLRGDK